MYTYCNLLYLSPVHGYVGCFRVPPQLQIYATMNIFVQSSLCKYVSICVRLILESRIAGSKIQAFSILLETIKLFTNHFTSFYVYQQYMRESKLFKSKNSCSKIMQVESEQDALVALVTTVGRVLAQQRNGRRGKAREGVKSISWSDRGMHYRGIELERS